MRKLVVIESPWAGMPKGVDPLAYLQQCIRHSLECGEAPVASHAMFCATQALDDNNDSERALGMSIGRVYIAHAALVAVYADYGISSGMKRAMEYAHSISKPVLIRRILGNASVDV